MNTLARFLSFVLLGVLAAAQNPPLRVGPHPDGGYLLSTGWRVTPAGSQLPLGETLPMNLVFHPDGKHLFILNAGYLPPSLLVLDTANPKKVMRVALEDAWLGMAISRTGDRIYIPEGNLGTVREFIYKEGVVKPGRQFRLFPLADPSKTGIDRLSKNDFLSDAALSSDGKTLFVANLQADAVHFIDLEKGQVSRKIPVGRRPYRLLSAADRLYVSNWGGASISVLNPATGETRSTIQTGSHPTDMLLYKGLLFVACANTNFVYVHDAETGGVREQINVALHPKSPPGSTPNALALSANGKRLFVANADNNSVAVIALGEKASSVEGFIPTGWYPTAVAVSRDGRLYVANGKGERSYPNPDEGPQPNRRAYSNVAGYVGRMQKGSLSIIDTPDEGQLTTFTRRVLDNSPYRDELLEKAPGASGVIPARPGGPSPIKHVIYVIKENRTYDQMFGDIEEGNGDPRLVLFGEDISPNHHRLAREFVLLDNFYVTADVSADGHAWSMGAISSDFTSKLWPANYGRRYPHYPSEGEDETATPGGGWLFNAAIRAGVSFRTYGEWVRNNPDPTKPGTARDKALEGLFDPYFRSFDMDYPDQKRMDRWLQEFRQFEEGGNLPALQVVRLPNDHTAGTRPGAKTPRATVADNDWALGRLVEAVSRSRYWKDTAIFVLEDDAQNGPDHVDSHRSICLVLSAYSKRGVVDSTMYNTVSVLRTIGLILGLEPMSQFDAGADPMHGVFSATADLRPYAAIKPQVNLDEVNPPDAPMAAESMAMDFSDLDRIDMDVMNQILWRAMKGDTPMPAPVRSAFPALWMLGSAAPRR